MLPLRRAVAIVAALAAAACSGSGGAAPTPSPRAELVLGLPPARSAEAQVAAAQALADQLGVLLKLPVHVRAEPTTTALDADLAAGSVDLAWTDALTYLALRRRYAYQPVVQGARCYPTYTASPPAAGCKPQLGTPAIIICGSGVSIPELADGGDWGALSGKPFALQEATSLSGYVWPRYFLAKNGVDPDKNLPKGPPTPSDVAVALAVYNGLVDCGAISGDGRQTAARFAPDIYDRTKVVFVAPGNIPADVVFMGGRLNREQAARVRDALRKLGISPAAAAPIEQLSGGATALLATGEHDFDLLRAAVAAQNPKLIDQLLPPPSPTPRRSPSVSPSRR